MTTPINSVSINSVPEITRYEGYKRIADTIDILMNKIFLIFQPLSIFGVYISVGLILTFIVLMASALFNVNIEEETLEFEFTPLKLIPPFAILILGCFSYNQKLHILLGFLGVAIFGSIIFFGEIVHKAMMVLEALGYRSKNISLKRKKKESKE